VKEKLKNQSEEFQTLTNQVKEKKNYQTLKLEEVDIHLKFTVVVKDKNIFMK
jgi:hypothetical protein